MSDVKRKTKKVEVEVVELKIELDADFFDNMEKAKASVAEQRGYDITYGEYIQEAMEDLVTMVEEYSARLTQASDIIKQQDEALGKPVKSEAPVNPETKEPEEAPAELYAHIIKDEDKHTMYQ